MTKRIVIGGAVIILGALGVAGSVTLRDAPAPAECAEVYEVAEYLDEHPFAKAEVQRLIPECF